MCLKVVNRILCLRLLKIIIALENLQASHRGWSFWLLSLVNGLKSGTDGILESGKIHI